MKRRNILILALMGIGLLWAPTAQPVKAAVFVKISGHVYDANGAGLDMNGVSVCAIGNGNQYCGGVNTTASCTDPLTGLDSGCIGTYSFNVLTDGKYRIHISNFKNGDPEPARKLNIYTITEIPLYTSGCAIFCSVGQDFHLPFKTVTAIAQFRDTSGTVTPVSGVSFDAASSTMQSDKPDSHLTLGYDQNGNPLAGYGSTSYASTPLTGNDGKATLYLLRSSTEQPRFEYTINAHPTTNLDKYAASSLSEIYVDPALNDQTVTLTLPAPVTLSGNVKNADGTIPSGVTVALESEQGDTNYVNSQVLGSSGAYSLAVAPGNYYLKIEATPGGSQTKAPQSLSMETDAPITLNPNGSLVKDLTIPEYQVDVYVYDPKLTATPTPSPTPVAPTPTPDPQGLGAALIDAKSNCPVQGLSLGSGLKISGCSIFDSGKPGAALTSYTQDDSFGYTTLWLLGSGTGANTAPYTITAHPSLLVPSGTYAPSTLTNVNISGDLLRSNGTNLKIPMSSPVNVSGHLKDAAGNPVGGITVALAFTPNGAVIPSTDTDGTGALKPASVVTGSDGSFTTPSFAPGTYYFKIGGSASGQNTLTNVAQSFHVQTSDSITISKTATVELALPQHQLAVHVTDANGAAVPNVVFAATSKCPEKGLTMTGTVKVDTTTTNVAYTLSGCSVYQQQMQAPTTTDGSGNASLWLLQSTADNPYTLTLYPTADSNFADKTVEKVSLPSAVTPDSPLNIQVTKLVKYSGTLQTSDGTPMKNVKISLGLEPGVPVQSTNTDGSGAFTFPDGNGAKGLVPGKYYMKISADPIDPGSGVPQSNAPQTLLLETPSTVKDPNTNEDIPPVIIPSSDTSGLTITVPLRKITVPVRDGGGSPVGNVKMDASSTCPQTALTLSSTGTGNFGTVAVAGCSSYDSSQASPALTDVTSGNVDLWLLDATGYTITAHPPASILNGPGHLSGVNVTADATTSTLTLPSLTTLSGRVLDNSGNPVPGITIALEKNLDGSPVASTRTLNKFAPCTAGDKSDCPGYYAFRFSPDTVGDYFIKVTASPGDVPYGAAQTLLLETTTKLHLDMSSSSSQDLTLPEQKVSVHVQDQNVAVGALPGSTLDATSAARQNNLSLTYAGKTLSARGSSRYQSALVPSVKADSNGNASLWLLNSDGTTSTSPSAYTITAHGPKGSTYFPTSANPVPVNSSTGVVTISLQLPLTYSGKVLDGNGNPASGVTVELENAPASPIAGSITDSSGNYSIVTQPGKYFLRVSAGVNDGQTGAPQAFSLETPSAGNDASNNPIPPVTVTSNTTENLTIPEHKITYTVQDSSSNPISGASFDAQATCPLTGLTLGSHTVTGCSSYDSTEANAVKTAADGTATLWLLQNVPYSVGIHPAPGSSFGSTAISGVTLTSDTSSTVTLANTVTLFGRLFTADGSTPATNVTVGLENAKGGTVLTSSSTRATGPCSNSDESDCPGYYSLSVPKGSYYLKVSTSAGGAQTKAPQSLLLETASAISLQTSVQEDLTLPEKQVQVTVKGPDGTALSGVTFDARANCLGTGCKQSDCPHQLGCAVDSLSLGVPGTATTYPASGTSAYQSIQPGAATTDASGKVTLWLLQSSSNPVKYALTAHPPARSSYLVVLVPKFTVDSTAASMGTPQTYALTMPHPVTISGIVKDGDGTPAKSVFVGVESGVGTKIVASALTDSTGKYSFIVSSGDYNLRVWTTPGGSQQNAAQNLSVETTSPISLTKTVSLAVTIPAYKLVSTVKNGTTPVPNVQFDVHAACPLNNLTVSVTPAGGTAQTFDASGCSSYQASWTPSLVTDSNGQATMWLLSTGTSSYTVTAYPPKSSGLTQSSAVLAIPIDSSGTVAITMARHRKPGHYSAPAPVLDGAGLPASLVIIALFAGHGRLRREE